MPSSCAGAAAWRRRGSSGICAGWPAWTGKKLCRPSRSSPRAPSADPLPACRTCRWRSPTTWTRRDARCRSAVPAGPLSGRRGDAAGASGGGPDSRRLDRGGRRRDRSTSRLAHEGFARSRARRQERRSPSRRSIIPQAGGGRRGLGHSGRRLFGFVAGVAHPREKGVESLDVGIVLRPVGDFVFVGRVFGAPIISSALGVLPFPIPPQMRVFAALAPGLGGVVDAGAFSWSYSLRTSPVFQWVIRFPILSEKCGKMISPRSSMATSLGARSTRTRRCSATCPIASRGPGRAWPGSRIEGLHRPDGRASIERA